MLNPLKSLKLMLLVGLVPSLLAETAVENPYWPMARNAVSYTLKLSAEDRAAKGTGTNAFWLAWAITSPEASESSRAPALNALQRLMTTVAERLESTAEPNKIPEGNFWNLQSMLEALRMMDNNQLFTTEERERWKSALQPAVEHEWSTYGQQDSGNWASSAAMQYPNADAQYAAVMMAAALLYDQPKYQESASSFVKAMNKYLYPLGAWRYFRNSNPIPLYHGFEIIFLGRYYQLSGDPVAADQIRRTKDFYPYTFTPENTVEGASTPWWKHGWNPTGGPYHAVEFVAWLSGDGYNRWFADLRAKSFARHYWVAYCGEAWDAGTDNRAEPMPFPDNFIVADESIWGLRGRFGSFSFMGSRGLKVPSFGSVLLANSEFKNAYDGYVQLARMGVAAPGQSVTASDKQSRLYANPVAIPTQGAQVLNDDFAALAAGFTPITKDDSPQNYDDWKVSERWLFTPQAVVAYFDIQALKDSPETKPVGLVALGPSSRPYGLEGDSFYIGNLHGRILSSKGLTPSISASEPNAKGKIESIDLSFETSADTASIQTGDTYIYAVSFSSDPSLSQSAEAQSDGSLTIQIGEDEYHLNYDYNQGLEVIKLVP